MQNSTAWYAAVLVLQSEVYSPSPDLPLFDHQIRLVRADNAEAAYERALFIGKSEEQAYTNPIGQEVRWRFLGLHDLVELTELSEFDSAEIYSFRVSAGRQFGVVPKEKLTVFWLEKLPDRPVNEWFD